MVGAKINVAQKTMIINWATVLRDTIKASYPADSLIRKPQTPTVADKS